MQFRILIAGLALLWAGRATAGEWFVDNVMGDDRNDGRFETPRPNAGPMRSLAKALAVAGPGDRIVLANTGVPYRDMISLSSGRLQGGDGQPFTIDGRGATLDGSQAVPAEAWENFSGPVFRFQPARRAYQQLFRDGRPLLRHPASEQEPLPELAAFQWCLYRGWIYFRVEAERLPADYGLTCCGMQTGITLYNVRGVVIANLTVQGFQLDGINAFDGVRNCRLQNVVCRGNGRAGLTVAGSSHVELVDSTLGDNGDAQLRTAGQSHTKIVASQLLDNTAPALERVGGTVVVDGVEVGRR